MTESELLSTISEAERDAVGHSDWFMEINEDLLARYFADPYGDEEEEKSSVVSTDVADTVDADMTSLARTFLGSNEVITFQANTDNPEEIQEAEEKSKYVDWLVREQDWSYSVLMGWLKDAEIQKMGVVKYFVDEKESKQQVKYENVEPAEIDGIIRSLEGEDVKSIDIEEQEEREGGAFDLKFSIIRNKKEIKIEGVPTENVLITRQSTSVDEATLVGDRMLKTRGELVADGYDKKLVASLSTVAKTDNQTATNTSTRMKDIRYQDEGKNQVQSLSEWSNQVVEVKDLYMLIDYDGDGIQERRRILKSGQTILDNEPFDHVPYAFQSAIVMPHSVLGQSRAEKVTSNQKVKTVLTRGMLDNVYMTNNQRNVISDDVDLDDMLTVRPNGIVRTDGPVQEAVFPLLTEFTGDKTLTIIQYLDFTRAQTTGTLMQSQGLDAEALTKETATRFEGVREEGTAKIELVARNYAETGWRKLYNGIAWMVSQFNDTETEIRVLGKALKVNPAGWRFENQLKSEVGLGAGDDEKLVDVYQSLFLIQQQLAAQGSSLVDQKKIFNTLSKIAKGTGISRVDQFFNDPEQPEELVLAENEQLKAMVEQLTMQLEQMQNPLAEAEEIRAMAKLTEAQAKASLEVQKLAQQNSQFQQNMQFKLAELSAKIDDQDQDRAVDITKIEVDAKKDIAGGLSDRT
ncbi:MAG: portal protein [Cyclobacteriaceae bacterium]